MKAKRNGCCERSSLLPIPPPGPNQNQILRFLTPEVRGRLFSRLERVPLEMGQVLYEPNCRIQNVYFPTTSIVALVYGMANGSMSELAVVGRDGLVGVSLVTGARSALSRAVVISSGWAYKLSSDLLITELRFHGEMMYVALRYTQDLITQIAQTAVCNLHHTVDQRLCRWLLLSLDRLDHSQLSQTQELMSHMLGVRREGVTEAALKLKNLKAITYSRGKMTVLNREILEGLSCECYSVVKRETDHLHMRAQLDTSQAAKN